MARDLNVTTVYVTHDQIEALTLADRIAVMRDGRIEDVGTPEQIFNDPATAFVAGFLGLPRINLMSAVVRVTAHHRVSLDFGAQSIALPPLDRRSMALSAHDGSRVIVGARSDAFTPAAATSEPTQLSGTLRAVEFHGHQWIAFVQAGIELINPDFVGTPAAPPPAQSHRRVRHAASQPSGLATMARSVRDVRLLAPIAKAVLNRAGSPSEPEPAAPTHRRADLVLEVNAGTGLQPGTKVHLAVDTTRLHIFDEQGRRIDRVVR